MPDPNRRGKLLVDLESARDAYRIARQKFDRAFAHAAEHPDRIEDLKSIESKFFNVTRRYHDALESYLEFRRRGAVIPEPPRR